MQTLQSSTTPLLSSTPSLVASLMQGSLDGEFSDEQTGDTQRWIVEQEEDSMQYSWLFDIIHDHTEGLFRYSRISGPYKLPGSLMQQDGDSHG